MSFTNRPLEIELGGQAISLFFDFATIRAFERETGNHFMNWVACVTRQAEMLRLELEMLGPADELFKNDLDKMKLIEITGNVMSLSDFATVVWAAWHTDTKPPRWLHSIEEVFELCDAEAFYKFSMPVMRVALESVQRRKIGGNPASESGEKQEVPTSPSLTKMPVSGGKTSGESPDPVLASLTKK